jgi:voltage-gated potassium channel Kch
MVVCGDDALAHRLAAELRDVYRERVTLVVPDADGAVGIGRAAALASAVLGCARLAVPRSSANGASAAVQEIPVLHAATPDDRALETAGAAEASALALVYKDDETNIRAALAARRLNPRLRLVIRLYNRKLGERLAQLLDQATPGADPDALDTSTTVLSDADTAAPALAATAVAGTSKVVQADGLLLRAVEHPPPGRGPVPDPGHPGTVVVDDRRSGGQRGSGRQWCAGPAAAAQ